VNGEWKPLAAACLLILCIGLAYGLALSPSDPFLPYKTAIQNGSSDQRNANEKPAMFESPAFIGIAAFLQAIGAIGTVWLIYRQLMTSRAQLRAYVVVSSAGIVSADDDRETAPVAVVTIQNSGQTPAHDVVNVSGIAIDLFPPPPTLSLTITDHDFAAVGRSRETLGPGIPPFPASRLAGCLWMRKRRVLSREWAPSMCMVRSDTKTPSVRGGGLDIAS
jgi:hypothetical protein